MFRMDLITVLLSKFTNKAFENCKKRMFTFIRLCRSICIRTDDRSRATIDDTFLNKFSSSMEM